VRGGLRAAPAAIPPALSDAPHQQRGRVAQLPVEAADPQGPPTVVPHLREVSTPSFPAVTPCCPPSCTSSRHLGLPRSWPGRLAKLYCLTWADDPDSSRWNQVAFTWESLPNRRAGGLDGWLVWALACWALLNTSCPGEHHDADAEGRGPHAEQPHFASEQSSDGALRLARADSSGSGLHVIRKAVGVRPRPAASFSSVFPVFLRRWP